MTVVAALGAALAVTAPPALAQDALYDRKQHLDSRISSLRNLIESAKEKEGVLSTEIAATGTEIEALEVDIAALSARVADLESDLARHRERLARLEERYREQTRHLKRLVREIGRAHV
jgi:septal ring factor EnvC (AmiA/AmiB activator)